MKTQQNAIEEYCRLNQIPLEDISTESNSFIKLKNIQGITIKQSFQPLEFLSGFQQENAYEVFGIDYNNDSIKIFDCLEKSNLLTRLFMSPETRPFQAKILNFPSKTEFIQLKRRFQCTFFCFNRPKLDVILTEGSEKNYLGYIVLPCKLSCDYHLEIYGKNKKLKYLIQGSLCQMGIICKNLPCEDCQKATFSLIDAKSKRELTEIKKKSAGFWKAAFSEADNFVLMFPKNMNDEDKALVMAATIFLDFNYFESKKRK